MCIKKAIQHNKNILIYEMLIQYFPANLSKSENYNEVSYLYLAYKRCNIDFFEKILYDPDIDINKKYITKQGNKTIYETICEEINLLKLDELEYKPFIDALINHPDFNKN